MSSEAEPRFHELRYTSEFKRNIRQLARRYRHIKSDLQPLLDALQLGQTPGDQVPGVHYEVFKVRLSNSDSGKGKSGGYRVIYQRVAEGPSVLITIYSKAEQADIAPHEIRQIIMDVETRDARAQRGPENATTESGAEDSNQQIERSSSG